MLGVNAGGTVVVGVSDSANIGGEAFRWTPAGGMAGLGFLPGGRNFSSAAGVSADGMVVVGVGVTFAGRQAFRWTQAGGMAGLGFLPGGFGSEATGVNADGTVVVGFSDATNIGSWRASASCLADVTATPRA